MGLVRGSGVGRKQSGVSGPDFCVHDFLDRLFLYRKHRVSEPGVFPKKFRLTLAAQASQRASLVDIHLAEHKEQT
jgi:hypothetical protein